MEVQKVYNILCNNGKKFLIDGYIDVQASISII